MLTGCSHLPRVRTPGSFPWTASFSLVGRKCPLFKISKPSPYAWAFSSCEKKSRMWLGGGPGREGLRFVRWSIVSGGWEQLSAVSRMIQLLYTVNSVSFDWMVHDLLAGVT